MQNAGSTGFKAKSASAALWLVCALVTSMVGAPLLAQDSGSGATVPPQNLLLEYREMPQMAVGWQVTLFPESKPFQKEPDLAQRRVCRGTLQFGGKVDQPIRFLWDYTQGKLHLDVNNNRDLTDDPVFTCSLPRVSDYSQTFTNIHLVFKGTAGSHPAVVELSLYYPRSPRPNASATCRSLWEGKVTLQGRDWQFGLAELTPGGSADRGLFLLRPWEARDEPIQNEAGSIDLFPFSPNLFFGEKAYRMDCSTVAQDGAVKCKLTLREKEAELGQLKLTGKYIQRLLLTAEPRRNAQNPAGFTVLLDHPGPVTKVPMGKYSRCEVQLQAGGVTAYRENQRYGSFPNPNLTISGTNTAELTAGGPLTNTVSVARRGRYLSLRYQLVGADGATYQLASRDRTSPPGFKIQKKGKVLHADKFQYG